MGAATDVDRARGMIPCCLRSSPPWGVRARAIRLAERVVSEPDTAFVGSRGTQRQLPRFRLHPPQRAHNRFHHADLVRRIARMALTPSRSL